MLEQFLPANVLISLAKFHLCSSNHDYSWVRDGGIDVPEQMPQARQCLGQRY
jgi:hypothetical protein